VGKSTVSAAVAVDLGAQVFRLREFAHQYRCRGLPVDELFHTDDALGWLSDEVVGVLLEAAFIGQQAGGHGLVVLENFPGSAVQLRLISEIARPMGAWLGIIELAADDATLIARVSARRVCSRCEPDPLGDPHRPALASALDPTLCGRCGARLSSRQADDLAMFHPRLERYRRRITTIRRAAVAEEVPYAQVDATVTTADCIQAVRAAVRSFGLFDTSSADSSPCV
jgi:adenylate kinase family enzyme